ncbi:hypothetical protein L1987_27561 [Smallanthus sonchifolius]|uniref:Uncharacterized protein n=1 Tax=Smallanthus sonchifolius TaxID=185202 RepID=A0ACB9IAR5_9ASTR|nr:hypothetical protein L1987_27561 [Smallanthus sonchifolius]
MELRRSVGLQELFGFNHWLRVVSSSVVQSPVHTMANKSNHNQSVQRQVNDYEISRLRRVQENKRRIQDLGLKRITNSLTSLVDSQKTKKNKVRSTYISNARDEQYIPDNDDDSEEDNTNVEVSKKDICYSNIVHGTLHPKP